MSFATPSDLATFLSTTFDIAGTTQAQLLLDIATSEIQGYTGQTLSQATSSVTLDAPVSGPLLLPELPVTAVTSVTVAGTALTLPGDITFTDYGVVFRNNQSWAYSLTSDTIHNAVVVTYTHGYAAIPMDIKGVCLSLAGRLLEGKATFTVDTEGNPANASVVPRAGVIGTFTDEEQTVMNRYRLIPVG